jgi:ABC-2 type transport system ATP-binding protein
MIETRELTKVYGQLRALDRLTLKLERGDVFGFIGRNGAGKTTTMRILATLLAPTWGEAYVCGQSIYTAPREVRRLIGFMPDSFGVYDDMRVIEYLEFFAAAYRIHSPQRRQVCDRALDTVDLNFKRDELVTSLSRGMMQRLGLARVLLHDPQVLLLDEPASGLDPRARIEMRALLRRLRDTGKTILVSSHILPELAEVCNKIGIIEHGQLLVAGDVSEVLGRVRRQLVLHIGIVGDLDGAARLVEQHAAVQRVDRVDGLLHVTLKPQVTDYSDLATQLVTAGFALREFHEADINLETAFLELTRGMTA